MRCWLIGLVALCAAHQAKRATAQSLDEEHPPHVWMDSCVDVDLDRVEALLLIDIQNDFRATLALTPDTRPELTLRITITCRDDRIVFIAIDTVFGSQLPERTLELTSIDPAERPRSLVLDIGLLAGALRDSRVLRLNAISQNLSTFLGRARRVARQNYARMSGWLSIIRRLRRLPDPPPPPWSVTLQFDNRFSNSPSTLMTGLSLDIAYDPTPWLSVRLNGQMLFAIEDTLTALRLQRTDLFSGAVIVALQRGWGTVFVDVGFGGRLGSLLTRDGRQRAAPSQTIEPTPNTLWGGVISQARMTWRWSESLFLGLTLEGGLVTLPSASLELDVPSANAGQENVETPLVDGGWVTLSLGIGTRF